MIKIRLARGGAKKRPYYSIVVADSHSPRDGRFIEKVGTYNPLLKKDDPQRVTLKVERLQDWMGRGAQPTDRVARFMAAEGLAKWEHGNNPTKGLPRQEDRGARRRTQAAARPPRRRRHLRPKSLPSRRTPRLSRLRPRRDAVEAAAEEAVVEAEAAPEPAEVVEATVEAEAEAPSASSEEETPAAEAALEDRPAKPPRSRRRRDAPRSSVRIPAPAFILAGRVAGAVRGAAARSGSPPSPAIRWRSLRYRDLKRADGAPALTLVAGRPAKGGLVARAKEADTREQAEALRGLELYIPRDALPAADDDEFYLVDLIGLEARDRSDAVVGSVTAVENFGAGDLLEIAPADGGPTWWLPFTKEAVPEVHVAGGLDSDRAAKRRRRVAHPGAGAPGSHAHA